jgi:hypothetical protein
VVALVAHQGGWDEALFVVIPLLVIIGLLGLAKRRAERLTRATPPPVDSTDTDADNDG